MERDFSQSAAWACEVEGPRRGSALSPAGPGPARPDLPLSSMVPSGPRSPRGPGPPALRGSVPRPVWFAATDTVSTQPDSTLHFRRFGGGAVGTAPGLGGAAFASRCGAGSRGAQEPGGILDCLLPGRGGILAAMVSDGEGRAGRDPPTPGLGGLGLARTIQVEHYVGGRVQPVWSLGE